MGILLTAILALLFMTTIKPSIDFKAALKYALKYYPVKILRNAEKIFRLESANFTSGQFVKTFSPGMEKFSDSYPYGWHSLRIFWDENLDFKPIGLEKFTENGTGKTKYFIKFKSVTAGLMTLCYFLSLHENNAARWFSTNADSQKVYNDKLAKIKTPFTDEL